MAKTAPLKRKKASASLHSRAARRASSPSLNLDKSITSAQLPSNSIVQKHAVLAARAGSGISKGRSRGRIASSKKRKRQERGLEKAEAVMDKTEKKVEKSFGKGKTVKERKAAWDNLNNQIAGKKRDSYILLAGLDEKEQQIDEAVGKETENSVIQDTTAEVKDVTLGDEEQHQEEVEVGEVL